MADRSMFSGWPFPPMRETNETIDAAELARRYDALLAERDRLQAEVERLRGAAEALLQHYEGDEPHPEERRYDRWLRQLNVRLEELAVAVAARSLLASGDAR